MSTTTSAASRLGTREPLAAKGRARDSSGARIGRTSATAGSWRAVRGRESTGGTGGVQGAGLSAMGAGSAPPRGCVRALPMMAVDSSVNVGAITGVAATAGVGAGVKTEAPGGDPFAADLPGISGLLNPPLSACGSPGAGRTRAMAWANDARPSSPFTAAPKRPAISSAVIDRSAGLTAKPRRTASRSAASRSGRTRSMDGNSGFAMARRTSTSDIAPRWIALRRARSSHNKRVAAYTSARMVTFSPLTCSGAK